MMVRHSDTIYGVACHLLQNHQICRVRDSVRKVMSEPLQVRPGGCGHGVT